MALAYITAQTIIDRIGNDKAVQLTTDSGTTPNAAKIESAGMGGEGIFNQYVGKRYRVPLDVGGAQADIAGMVQQYVGTLVIWFLHTLRPPVPEDVKDARDVVIAWLKAVADGDVILPSAEPIESTDQDGPDGEFGYNERVASRTNMAGL